MKLSIIIAEKERPRRVEGLVAELLKQKIPCEYEIIVIDAGGEMPVLDKSVLLIPINDNGVFNYNRARNVGAKFATGDYFLFLDCNLKPMTCAINNLVKVLDSPHLLVLGTRLKLTRTGSSKYNTVGSDAMLCFGREIFEAIGGFEEKNGKPTADDFKKLRDNVSMLGEVRLCPGMKFTSTDDEYARSWETEEDAPVEPLVIEAQRYREQAEQALAAQAEATRDLAQLKRELEGLRTDFEFERNRANIAAGKIEDLEKRVATEYLRGVKDVETKAEQAKSKIREDVANEIRSLEDQLKQERAFGSELQRKVTMLEATAQLKGLPTPSPGNINEALPIKKTLWQRLFG